MAELKPLIPMGFAPEQLPPEEKPGVDPSLKPLIVMEPETALDAAKVELTAALHAEKQPAGMPLAIDPAHAASLTKRRREAEINFHYETVNASLDGQLLRGSLGINMAEIDLRNDFTRSNEFSEKQAKFHQMFPEGVMQQWPVGENDYTIIFKRNASDPFWTEMNPPGLERGSIGTFMGSVVNEKVAGAVIGSVVMPVVGTAIGAVIGSGVQDSIEALRGYQDNTVPQMATHALVEGLIAGTIDTLTLGVAKVAPAVFGANPARIFRVNPNALESSRRAELAGLPSLMLAQVAEGDIARYSFSQAAGLGSQFAKNRLTNQQIALMHKLQRMSERQGEGFTDQARATLVGLRAKQLNEIAEAPITTETAAGNALKRGWDRFDKSVRVWINKGYDKARSFHDVTFDLRGTRGAVNDAIKGTRSRLDDPGAPGGLNRTQRIEAEFPEDFQKLLDKILVAKPVVSTITEGGKKFTSFEQMKTWRTQLFDFRFTHADPNVNRAAATIWKKLTESMENPRSGGGVEFQTAWRAASLRFRFAENIREKSFIAGIVRTDTPEVIARKLMVPGNASAINLTRRIMPPEEWAVVQNAFKAKLMDRGATPSIARALGKWNRNQRGLNLLISPQERKALLEWEVASNRWEKGVGKIINDETKHADDMVNNLLDSERGVIDDLIANSPGKSNGHQATSMRAGLYQRLLDGSLERNQAGVEVVNVGKLADLLLAARKTRKYDAFMRKGDWARLEDMEAYAFIVRTGPDVGGELQRAAVAASLKNPLKAGAWFGAVRTVGVNKVVGRMLAADASYAVLKSASGKFIDARRLRAVAVASGIAFYDARQGHYQTKRIVGDTGRARERVEGFRNRRINREATP